MQVFLIPVGGARYVLYSEMSDERVRDHEPKGFIQRQVHRLQRTIEAAQREPETPDGIVRREGSWQKRLRARVVKWIAEHVEEQRLLWRLRSQLDVELVHPSDINEALAFAEMRALIQRDLRRHLTWLIVNGLVFVATGLLAVVPGPNLLAYYFGFRLLSHYLAWLGARRALGRVAWRGRASDTLAGLRQALALDLVERELRTRAAADRLGLPRLTAFLSRVAPPTA